MVAYDEAIQQLKAPQTWCRAAETLAEIGDQRALSALARAYETPVEAPKLCLLEAMDALGALAAAHEMYASPDPEERRLAVHLMELFPDDQHLPVLEDALADPDAVVRGQALRSLRLQLQSPHWEALLVRLLGTEDEAVRMQAIQSLARRQDPAVREALGERLSVEQSRAVREALERALATP